MIEDLDDAKEQLIDYFGGKKELKKATDDEIDDAINELADSNCDVYTGNVLAWVINNYYKVEDAIEEFGFPETDGKPDLIKAIQGGQFIANRRFLERASEELRL